MSAESAFTRSWRVGAYLATLSCPRPHPGATAFACIEWEPSIPQRMTPAEVTEYRVGRDSALAELAEEMVIALAIVNA